MDEILIAEMGLDGGGCTVYGQCVAGTWSFWQEGVSMYFDENDDEAWKPWSTEPVAQLTDALPKSWWLMYVLYVHPDFVEQLRTAFYTHRRKRNWQEQRFSDLRRE